MIAHEILKSNPVGFPGHHILFTPFDKVLKHTLPIHRVRSGQGAAHALRVPLHPKDGQAFVLHAFDDVLRPQYGTQFRSQSMHRLMMIAVNNKPLTIHFFPNTSGQTDHLMNQILTSAGAVIDTVFQMLMQCAAKISAQHLTTPANAQNRLAGFDKGIQ